MVVEKPYTALAWFLWLRCAVQGFILMRCLYEEARSGAFGRSQKDPEGS